MKTIQGPAIFLAQFLGDEPPFDSLEHLAQWAADLGYKGLQLPTAPRLFDLEQAASMPGWAQELAGVHTPETETYGISSFVYRAKEPFHAQRLHDYISQPIPGVVRSKGYFWLAGRPEWMASLSGAGKLMNIEPVGLWWASVPKERWPTDAASLAEVKAGWSEPYGDRYQELVFIGQDMDQAAIEADLKNVN